MQSPVSFEEARLFTILLPISLQFLTVPSSLPPLLTPIEFLTALTLLIRVNIVSSILRAFCVYLHERIYSCEQEIGTKRYGRPGGACDRSLFNI